MEMENKSINMEQIEKMFGVGAHYAYTKTKRHPSTKAFIFGSKNGTELFDLEKTNSSLEEAKKFIREIFLTGNKQILFVGSKSEIKDIVKKYADKVGMPNVTNRWVGGTLTNFDEVKKRAEKYQKLLEEKETGGLSKYTKKEKSKIEEEILRLERKFSGVVSMKTLPTVLFVIDPRHEAIAVEEANQKNIPVIALANSDCDIKKISYPILANDSVAESVEFFVNEIASVCKINTK